MNHFLENIFKLFMIVYILCNQIIGLNSKSSILWKLNDKSGKIYSFSDNDQHVSRKKLTPPSSHHTHNPVTLMCCFTYINLWMYRLSNKHTFDCIACIHVHIVCAVQSTRASKFKKPHHRMI